MARLPVPGDDIGSWGGILNEFLRVSHNEDGTLKFSLPDATPSIKGVLQLTSDLGGTADAPKVVSTSLAAPLPINQGGTAGGTRDSALNNLLPDQPSNTGKVLKTDGANVSWADVTALVPDATDTIKGKLKLAGDLSGTADSPTVVSTSLAAPLPINQGGTSANTRAEAINALLPTQSSNGGKILETNGSDVYWNDKPNTDDVLALTWMEVGA